MTDEQIPHDTHEHAPGHIVPIRLLVIVCTALLFLTAVTVWAAHLDFEAIGLSEFNIGIAMAIALIKASLVSLFFMHLKWDRTFHSFVFLLAVVFVALFISFALMDTSEYRDQIAPGSSIQVQQMLDALDQ